jgi:HEAT repeat protein
VRLGCATRQDPEISPQRFAVRPEWLNAVGLAGKLKLADTIPALVKWIRFRDSNLSGQNADSLLLYTPAARALADIGEPSVPAMRDILEHDTAAGGIDSDRRLQAVYILGLVGTPEAKAALREYAANGQDAGLVEFVKTFMLK